MRLFRRGGARTWYATFYENGVRVQRTTKCVDRKATESVARQWERDAADPESATLMALRSATHLLSFSRLALKRRELDVEAKAPSRSTRQSAGI